MCFFGKHKTINILISGWYGNGNIGDEAMLLSILGWLKPQMDSSKARVVILSENPKAVTDAYGLVVIEHFNIIRWKKIITSPLVSLWAYFKELLKADIVVLGGGSHFFNVKNFPILFQLLDEFLLSSFLGKKTLLLGVGIGRNYSQIGRLFFKAAINRIDLITVRDRYSYGQLSALKVKNFEKKVILSSDLTFGLKVIPDEACFAKDIFSDPGLLKIGINLKWDYPDSPADFIKEVQARYGDLFRVISSGINGLMKEKKALIFLVPFRAENKDNDYQVLSEFTKYLDKFCKDRIFLREKVFSPKTTKWLLGQMDINIAMRLHALIFSLDSAVPFIGLGNHIKIKSFFADINYEESYFKFDNIDADKFNKRLKLIVENIDAEKEKLSKIQQEELQKNEINKQVVKEVFYNYGK